MVKVFAAITTQGVGDPTVLAGGISEALITTAAGLTVAIPSLIGYRYLNGRVNALAVQHGAGSDHDGRGADAQAVHGHARGAAMRLQSGKRAEPEINLTSLIDVVLLLLVFFMVTTSFVRESELTIRLPEVTESAETTVETGELEITVTSRGNYFVNGRALVDNRPGTLRSAVTKLAPNAGDVRVTITADAQASHQSVVTAMDVAGKLGFTDISISTISTPGDGE